MHVAFSRDQAEKVYVQHLLRETAAQVWKMIDAGAHIYVCGLVTSFLTSLPGGESAGVSAFGSVCLSACVTQKRLLRST